MPRVYLGMQIGDWVSRKIKRAGLTQGKVSDRLNISQQALSRKIKNNSFSYSDMCQIFEVTGTADEEISKVMKGVF